MMVEQSGYGAPGHVVHLPGMRRATVLSPVAVNKAPHAQQIPRLAGVVAAGVLPLMLLLSLVLVSAVLLVLL